MFAHRRVACTAKLDSGSAQFDEATDEIDEDLEDREEVSEISDSGDESEDTGRTSGKCRVDVGIGAGAVGFRC